MALQNDLENIVDKASRALSIIAFIRQQKAQYQDNPDLEIDIAGPVKQALQDKRDQLVNQIKNIAAGI